MGGEGFMFSALASIKNNREQRKHINPFRKRAKDMHVHHIEGHDAKHLSKREMGKLRTKLLKENRREQRRLILIFAVLIVLLVVVIFLVSGSAIF